MLVDEMKWSGMKLGDYVLKEEIGRGAFSCVYQGLNPDTGARRAFKFARTFADEYERKYASRALLLVTGGTVDVRPDPVELLKNQYARLKDCPDSAFPQVDEIVFPEGYCYYRMELIDGRPLQELIDSRHSNIDARLVDIFVKLCRCLETLEAREGFDYHGDIKPDNILIVNDGVRLLDPGYFGPLKTEGGSLEDCVVTTVAYYPFLVPDDLFAVAITLWEAALHQQPFASRVSSEAIDRDTVSDRLLQHVRNREMIGQYFLTPLLVLPRPTDVRSGISSSLEEVLLKAMRLRFSEDGKRDLDPGFSSIADLKEALESLSRLNR